MKPYYADASVTIYHADNRAVLPLLAPGMAVATDQPYGTGWAKGGGSIGVFTAKHEQPEWDRWDMSWVSLVREPRALAVFGPYSRRVHLQAALPKPNAIVWWKKTNPRPNGPDREPICVWPATLPDRIQFEAYNGDAPFHPTQKPLDLMLWVLGFLPPNAVVLDPFIGSGSTLVAAKELGRQAIGIETNEQYCEVAATRLSQSVIDFSSPAA